MNDNKFGAVIERGEIAAITDGGYIVVSLSRDGLVTPALPAMGEESYAAGDRVYFFMFNDGHGMIIAAFS